MEFIPTYKPGATQWPRKLGGTLKLLLGFTGSIRGPPTCERFEVCQVAEGLASTTDVSPMPKAAWR
jgi:hypothetical protein